MQVVVYTPDVVGLRMAGPGIRAYHLATELAKRFPTALIAKLRDFEPDNEGFTAIEAESAAARAAMVGARVVLGQPSRAMLSLTGRQRKLVFDMFDPTVLELRELYGKKPTIRQQVHFQREWGRIRAALARGDLLVSATPRQRDFYAGVHAAMGGDLDSWMQRWIDVPFGIDESAPIPKAKPEKPPLVLWGGGLWEWLDPVTAINAIRISNERGVRCKLVFLGGSRPNSAVKAETRSRWVEDAARAMPDLVKINEGWVPYAERGEWLARSRVSMFLHRATMEADFSIRTRLFDAIWGQVPVIATAGGWAAELVEREGLGLVIQPGDPRAAAEAVERLVRDDVLHARCVSSLARIRPAYGWSVVARPLVEAIARWL